MTSPTSPTPRRRRPRGPGDGVAAVGVAAAAGADLPGRPRPRRARRAAGQPGRRGAGGRRRAVRHPDRRAPARPGTRRPTPWSPCREPARTPRRRITEATRLIDDVAGAVRDFRPDELVELLDQLEDLDVGVRPQAAECSRVDIERERLAGALAVPVRPGAAGEARWGPVRPGAVSAAVGEHGAMTSTPQTRPTVRCGIVPPYLLEHLGYGDTLLLDDRIRARAPRPSRADGAAPLTGAWTVHDAGNGTDLPGRPVRSAGEPESGDAAVDEAAAGHHRGAGAVPRGLRPRLLRRRGRAGRR